MQSILNIEHMCDMVDVLEVGLVMKMGNNWKTKSCQTRMIFFPIILDENNGVKSCGLECNSMLTHSTQHHTVAQLTSGSGTYSKVKYNEESLNYHVPSFHEKAQTFHHAVEYDLDIILLLLGK